MLYFDQINAAWQWFRRGRLWRCRLNGVYSERLGSLKRSGDNQDLSRTKDSAQLGFSLMPCSSHRPSNWTARITERKTVRNIKMYWKHEENRRLLSARMCRRPRRPTQQEITAAVNINACSLMPVPPINMHTEHHVCHKWERHCVWVCVCVCGCVCVCVCVVCPAESRQQKSKKAQLRLF